MSDWRRSSDGDSGPVVPPYTKIPSGQKRGGNPAIFIEDLDDEAKVHIQGHVRKLLTLVRSNVNDNTKYI
jgi:hypothetical protein